MVFQYRPVWSTTGGGVGYSVFNARELGAGLAPAAWAAAIREFFNANAASLPTDVTIQFPSEVLELNTANGELVGIRPVTTVPAAVVGTATGGYNAAGGARVDWVTDGIVAGRRVRGRTFLVPMVATGYDPDGTIATTFLTRHQNAANAYLAVTADNAQPVVWSRPTPSRAGSVHDIVSAQAVDKSAILRGRRD